ncbi:MAG: glycoside hydrolase family 127 protein [Clostridia bacterium]|nr:glycoside hydrolase family 127 protein [Clostridia bacterium]
MSKNKVSDTLYRAPVRQNYTGCADAAVRFLTTEQLTDRTLWRRFVGQFREQPDGENRGWRGEYWGKMMRGAVTVWQYSHDPALFETLTETVRDMLSVAEEDGRVSSFSRDTEFQAWDLWCRKYVLLGMEYYLEICTDEALREEILRFLCRALDYILQFIGEGKIPAPCATESWRGVNSCSILEPVVRLYTLCDDRRYLDFATHIVTLGAADGLNLFELAYKNKLYPYQYGVAKAYEMISCFEGLLEYYRLTGIEKYKISAVNFGRAIMASDVTVIGSCGCTHELFDHSTARQTAAYDGIMQETCVTVTWMKYCAQLLRLTGDPRFADCMEQSFYNAYLGSLNTEHKSCDYIREKFIGRLGYPRTEYTFLPFDSYSPLTPGRRGRKVGGAQILSDLSYYGCCVCIGAAGVGTFLGHAVMQDGAGDPVLNFYENGEATWEADGHPVTLEIKTAYPADGNIRLTLRTPKPTALTLKCRLPAWSEQTEINSPLPYTADGRYLNLGGIWEDGTSVELCFDMRVRATLPVSWESDTVYTEMDPQDSARGIYNSTAVRVFHRPEDDGYISLSRGPLTLAADSRTGKAADSPFSFRDYDCRAQAGGEITHGVPCLLSCTFTDRDGMDFRLVDYASAGRDWETVIAAWLPTN